MPSQCQKHILSLLPLRQECLPKNKDTSGNNFFDASANADQNVTFLKTKSTPKFFAPNLLKSSNGRKIARISPIWMICWPNRARRSDLDSKKFCAPCSRSSSSSSPSPSLSKGEITLFSCNTGFYALRKFQILVTFSEFRENPRFLRNLDIFAKFREIRENPGFSLEIWMFTKIRDFRENLDGFQIHFKSRAGHRVDTRVDTRCTRGCPARRAHDRETHAVPQASWQSERHTNAPEAGWCTEHGTGGVQQTKREDADKRKTKEKQKTERAQDQNRTAQHGGWGNKQKQKQVNLASFRTPICFLCFCACFRFRFNVC